MNASKLVMLTSEKYAFWNLYSNRSTEIELLITKMKEMKKKTKKKQNIL